MIHIVNKRRYSGSQVYCGRGSALGNPFPINNNIGHTRDVVCDMYEEWFAQKVAEKDFAVMMQLSNIELQAKHGDVVLSCYCAPQRCHCETIKRYIETKLNEE